MKNRPESANLAGIAIACSPNKHEVLAYTLGAPHLPKFVLIGGVHGDEPEGAVTGRKFHERG